LRSVVLSYVLVLLLAALQAHAVPRGFESCNSAEGRYFRTTPNCVYGGRRFNGRPVAQVAARRAIGYPISGVVSMRGGGRRGGYGGGLYGPVNTG